MHHPSSSKMTTTREIPLGSLRLGANNPLFLIAGPCVIESEAHARKMAETIAKIAADAGIPYIFKASYDKANRSSPKSFRGPGLKEGLRILSKIKHDLDLPVLSDIHEPSQAAPAAVVCDILQIPAFLSRQTDLLEAAAKTNRIVNVKKAQFLSPWDMNNVVEKVSAAGNDKIILTERGASFGYQNLVVDMRSFPILKKLGYPGSLRRNALRPTPRRPRPRQRRSTRIHRTLSPRRRSRRRRRHLPRNPR